MRIFCRKKIDAFILLWNNHISTKKVRNTVIFFVLILILLIAKFDLWEIIISRFSDGGYAGSKTVQAVNLIKEGMMSPIFGMGIGHDVSIVYYNGVRRTNAFEVMWAEAFMQLGIVGLFIYLAIIGNSLMMMYKRYRYTNNSYLGIAFLGVTCFCVTSFFNPFMSNTIGILYFLISLGMLERYKHYY